MRKPMLITTLLKIVPLHLKLHLHGVKFGSRVTGNTCNIINRGSIEIGNSVSLNSFPSGEMFKVGLFAYFKESTVKIGNKCNLNGTIIFCRKKVVIGDCCMFGPGVVILDNSSHNSSIDPIIRRTGKITEAPVIVEDNVWVGRRSIIMKGVRLGKNCIITPNSVVIKDVPQNIIFGGNPAKFIKTLG